MTTPEGRVKKNIDRVLASFDFVYAFKPVQFGAGAAGVDYHCVAGVNYHIGGVMQMVPVAFFIEAKKPGGEPTNRQDAFLKDRREKQNCMTFVIDDDPSINHVTGGLEALTKWLEGIEEHNERARRTRSVDAGSGVQVPAEDIPSSEMDGGSIR